MCDAKLGPAEVACTPEGRGRADRELETLGAALCAKERDGLLQSSVDELCCRFSLLETRIIDNHQSQSGIGGGGVHVDRVKMRVADRGRINGWFYS